MCICAPRWKAVSFKAIALQHQLILGRRDDYGAPATQKPATQAKNKSWFRREFVSSTMYPRNLQNHFVIGFAFLGAVCAVNFLTKFAVIIMHACS